MRSASPFLVRPAARRHPIRALAAPLVDDVDPAWAKDLKLFVTGWLGGLVFFGTLLA